MARLVPARKKFKYRRKALALKQHFFSERIPDTVHSLNTGTLTNGTTGSHFSSTLAWTFQISDVQQWDHYKDLFEYYMIKKVVVDFRYKTAGNYGNSSSTSVFNEVNPTLLFKVDHNDIVGETVGDMLESCRTRKKQLTNSKPNFTITLKPAIQTELYKTAISSAYAPKWNTWLSTADETVPHYGLKVQITCPNISSGIDFGSIEISKRIYFAVKNND